MVTQSGYPVKQTLFSTMEGMHDVVRGVTCSKFEVIQLFREKTYGELEALTECGRRPLYYFDLF